MSKEDRPAATPIQGLKFKGGRDYLHGTDILHAVLDFLRVLHPSCAITDIDIAFHGLARTGLTLLETAPPGIEPVVQFACRIDGARSNFALVEDGRPILERYEFAEEDIVTATDIHVDSAYAKIACQLPCTNIERWIAMVKALHLAVYPELRGKWLFVRGKFAHYEEAYGSAVEHRVALRANFNNKLTRCAIMVDGKPLGDIYFSRD